MDKPDAFEFPSLTQIGNKQNHLVSQSRELTAKFKNVTGAGVFGSRIDSGKIKNFHEFTKKSYGKDKREWAF